ncbi:hypothetical protein ABT317_09835, partial [Streptomyces carpinensis]
ATGFGAVLASAGTAPDVPEPVVNGVDPQRATTFPDAQATSGDLTDPAYQEARRRAPADARAGVDNALAANRLDAIFTPARGGAAVLRKRLRTGHHAVSSPASLPTLRS